MLALVQCWSFTALSCRKDMILCHLLKMRWLESRERRRRQSPAAAKATRRPASGEGVSEANG